MNLIALIPARKGSKRIPGKNMALLAGKPLLQYTIEAAIESVAFDEIVVSTDWDECENLAIEMGVDIIRRPEELCRDNSHDFEWVSHALDIMPGFDAFMILRPTSPFRTWQTIRRAIIDFVQHPCDSMRAVEKTKSHPRKSWLIAESGLMYSYFVSDDYLDGPNGFCHYDLPTQAAEPVYCQNGCIHIAWTRVLEKYGNVSGKAIRPFFTEGYENVDINDPDDLEYAEWLIEKGKVC